MFCVQTYAFAAFDEEGAALNAASALNGRELGGWRLRDRLVTQA